MLPPHPTIGDLASSGAAIRNIHAYPMVSFLTDDSAERAARLTADLRQHNISFTVLPTHVVKSVTRGTLAQKKIWSRHNTAMAVQACARRTHRRADICVVLEDDAILHVDFAHEVLRTVNALPADWDVLHLCPISLSEQSDTQTKLNGLLRMRPVRPANFMPSASAERRVSSGASCGGRCLKNWTGVTPGGLKGFLIRPRAAVGFAAALNHFDRFDLTKFPQEAEWILHELRQPTHYVAFKPQLCHRGVGSWGWTRPASESASSSWRGLAKRLYSRMAPQGPTRVWAISANAVHAQRTYSRRHSGALVELKKQ